MIQHYLIIAWRNLIRNRFFSLINIAGFAIAITCSLLLGMYSWHETHYDNFHEKKDHIFLVGAQGKTAEDEWEGGWTTPPLGPALDDYFAEVEAFTRLCFWFEEVPVSNGDQKVIEKGIVGADSSVFDIFTIPFVEGNPATALALPNSIVLTQSAAKKYFGDENPMGQTLHFDHFFNECKVTGIVEDYPDNSHFDFEILLSLSSLKTINFNFDNSWHNHTFVTYVLLNDQVIPSQVSAKFPQFLKDRYEPYLLKRFGKTYTEMYQGGDYYRFFLKPLDQVHLSTLVFENREGVALQTYALGIIGLVILLLAVINYVNLSTAISSNRAKEIGIRKTIGSGKMPLIKQFIAESVSISLLGLAIGVLLLDICLPYFNNITGQNLSLDYTDPLTILGLIGFALLIGVLGGIYPALVISSFKPVSILGQQKQFGGGKVVFRNILVMMQFAICVIMIISTLVVYKQFKFMQNINLGFDTDQVLVVRRPGLLNKNQEAFKQELLKRSDVINVSYTNTIPGRHFDGHGQHFQEEPMDKSHTIYPLVSDIDLLETLDLEIVQGQQFDPEHPDRKVALINEAAVRKLQMEDPLDMVIDRGTMGNEPYPVIGVVKDFHFNSFHHQVEPLVIFPLNQLQDFRFDYILVKVQSGDVGNTVKEIEKSWQQLSNHGPFDYTFLDQDFNRLFQREQITAKVYATFSFISIFIACLGLLGMISYFIVKRTKEIGIRKIVGASTRHIILLLSKDFSKWMIISFVIGMPLAWYFMHNWIQNFAYKTKFDWWIFALAGGIVLVIALLTVSMQTVKAALTKPVDSLRNE
ncbi:ABC transporter permease [Fulvivirgaceae bacterium BMA10]|uniref:ABC transporter permease n=1 Tax=Splendidivirga corallicola TaxID=3051826 RepID=A0ABT8KYQ9_9BACT|nr:ABC transporter permease [Fulvivirgaceae bacterium BMA10]